MNFFIKEIFANSANKIIQEQGTSYSFIFMFIIFGLIFYFMILRPQQKRNKEHKKLMESISKGDEVLTTGGIIGRVTKVSETNYITISINENNEIIIKQDFIATILPKGTIKSIQ
ncbi:MAG: preprotein translocase subunit YajC [Arsenophonus sp.]|nr:MAG: preprotein translocase subunit YajC [Arsenophonus sp.]